MNQVPLDHKTTPLFMSEAQTINKELAGLSAVELGALMKINEKLAAQNRERNRQWSLPEYQKETTPALLSYSGEMYKSIAAADFSSQELDFAQDRLRLLSGLYGVLRPMDAILPYRLEMACKLGIGESKNLYGFWSQKITRRLTADLKQFQTQSQIQTDAPFLLNLASNEYFKCIKKKELEFPILTIVFKEFLKNNFKSVPIYAKQARGLMTRFIIKNRITQRKSLKTFNLRGYAFNEALSTPDEWIFTRKSLQ
ncbi:MAG: YaaA family protein [bacterium]|nr:YaaA family protein [bacterium]